MLKLWLADQSAPAQGAGHGLGLPSAPAPAVLPSCLRAAVQLAPALPLSSWRETALLMSAVLPGSVLATALPTHQTQIAVRELSSWQETLLLLRPSGAETALGRQGRGVAEQRIAVSSASEQEPAASSASEQKAVAGPAPEQRTAASWAPGRALKLLALGATCPGGKGL